MKTTPRKTKAWRVGNPTNDREILTNYFAVTDMQAALNLASQIVRAAEKLAYDLDDLGLSLYSDHVLVILGSRRKGSVDQSDRQIAKRIDDIYTDLKQVQ